jgi:hypothetical protein
MQATRIRHFTARQAMQWFSCGWRMWRRQPLAATVPLAVFVPAALLLRWIPVIGDVILLLLLPSVVASVLVHLHLIAQTSGRWRRPRSFKSWLVFLRQALFGAWGKSANVYSLILIGFVLVVIGLLGYALVNAVGGQAVVSPYGFLELTAVQMGRFLLAYCLVTVLWLVITAVLLWTVPLLIIRDLALFEAFWLALRGLRHNGAAVATLLLVSAAVLWPAVPLKLWSPLAAVLAWWLATTLAALLLMCSDYCSFRLVFAVAEGQAAPSVQPRPEPQRS